MTKIKLFSLIFSLFLDNDMFAYVKIPKAISLRARQEGLIFLCLFFAFGLKGQGVDLELSRSVDHSGERQYMVTVEVKKEGLSGYAKLEENIPEGFVAHEKELRSSNYIFKDGKAKFIWMDLPKEDRFSVSYKLIQKKSDPGTYSIEGRFSCVSGDDLIRVSKSSEFEVKSPEPVASRQMEREEGSEKELPSHKDEEVVMIEDNGSENGSKEEEERKSGERIADDPEEMEDPSGIGQAFFSVQIGAFSKEKPRSFFKKRFGVNDEEVVHYRDGELHKYSLGKYDSYEEADKAKKKFRAEGGGGAFVIGFRGEEPVKASALLE